MIANDLSPATVTKAVLLAAGRGTRMRELTQDVPKPMLPVRGRPILDHIVGGLAAAGVREVLIVVGYRADVVTGHFGDGAAAGVRMSYVTQVTQDGTGRVVELARDFAGSDAFILSYGDILIDPANYRVLARPGDEEAIVTVKYSEDVSKGGAVFVNEAFELVDLREKPRPGEVTSPWYNAGVYLFRPSIFDFTARLEKSVRGEYELTDAIRALAQSGRRVRAYELSGEWADVRDPEILAELDAQDHAPSGDPA
jgi:NDP-sugar pyrophosphorylase family protein